MAVTDRQFLLLLHLGLCALYLHGFGSGLAGLSQHDRLVRFAVIVPGPGPTTATGIPLALGLLATFRPMFDFIGSLIEHWCISGSAQTKPHSSRRCDSFPARAQPAGTESCGVEG